MFLNFTQFVQITESLHQESLSTSALLYYCQCKILRPYSRLLCLMGLRPSTVENTEHDCILTCCSYKHLVFVLVLMFVGYILQYMTCFRYNVHVHLKHTHTAHRPFVLIVLFLPDLTNWTPWARILFQKLIVTQAAKKFHTWEPRFMSLS